MNSERFLIFALARTGSTSLMNLMNISKSINLISEPFNKKNSLFLTTNNMDKFGKTEIKNLLDLKNELDVLINIYGYNGIKHVWHPSGFPFENITEMNNFLSNYVSMNQHLLTFFDKVLFLNRKNVLKRIVSGLISMQTKVWEANIKIKTVEDKEFEFKELDESSIVWFIEFEKFYVESFKNDLNVRKIDYYEIFFEDLFEDTILMEDKIKKCYEMYDFFDASVDFNEDDLTKMNKILGPDLKLNDITTYLKIPNIYEIEEKFGSEENGYLLK
jgi:hypothetical protein